MAEKVIAKVRESSVGQKIVTVPKESSIKKDDYVEIKKIGGEDES